MMFEVRHADWQADIAAWKKAGGASGGMPPAWAETTKL